jgi:hypothetical protein
VGSAGISRNGAGAPSALGLKKSRGDFMRTGPAFAFGSLRAPCGLPNLARGSHPSWSRGYHARLPRPVLARRATTEES